jgi:hypothetical protein
VGQLGATVRQMTKGATGGGYGFKVTLQLSKAGV